VSELAGERAGVPAGSLTVAGPPEAAPPPGAAPAAAPQGVDAGTGFASVGRALADLAAGRPVVVVDDADRENEGDLIFAAEKATPELVSFMVRYTSG
jgi:3,4-dihydroxy 2-butanone 4-phosphate synthase / GTP cyclohydrolase II